MVVDQGRTFVLALLGAFVLGSAGSAVVRGMWELHLAAVSILAVYIAWLLEEKHKRAERRRKVRSLHGARPIRRAEPLRAAAGDR